MNADIGAHGGTTAVTVRFTGQFLPTNTECRIRRSIFDTCQFRDFRINFSRCIFCGLCEEACPTTAIQLTPDFEMGEYKRQDLVYEKEDLLISGPGKYPEYNFYRMAGMAIDGKDKGEAENEAKPIDVKSLLP